MPVSIGAKPDHSFRQPLGLLTDCHRRIEQFLSILRTLARRRSGQPFTDDEAAFWGSALRYFREAAPKHTEDEERSLFPRLREIPAARDVLARLDALEADHVRAGALHRVVDRLGQCWLADGQLPDAQSHQLTEALDELAALYRQHIAMEEQELFPLAERLLPPAEQQQVGREMAARRRATRG